MDHLLEFAIHWFEKTNNEIKSQIYEKRRKKLKGKQEILPNVKVYPFLYFKILELKAHRT